jgi:hypothetical protein
MDWLKLIMEKILERSWEVIMPLFIALGAFISLMETGTLAKGQNFYNEYFGVILLSFLYLAASLLCTIFVFVKSKMPYNKKARQQQEKILLLSAENEKLRAEIQKIAKDKEWEKIPIAGKL